MKVQCDLCKEIVDADFAVSDGAIELSCPSCRGRFAVPATRSRRVTGPEVTSSEGQRARRASMPAPHEPAMVCPKCGERQRPGPACRACGLAADRMPDYMRDENAMVPANVAAEWQRVRGAWSDPAAHDRFAEAVAAADVYPWGARRYREALREREDDPIATEQIARLARMAEATLLATAAGRPSREPSSYRGMMAIILMLMLVLGAGLAYTLIGRRGGDEGRRTPAVPAATPGSTGAGARAP